MTAAARNTTGSARRVIIASLIGASLEWFDFFLYSTAAVLVFNQLFFPQFDPLTGRLLAFATHGVAFIARPLGGALFGHLGDRLGRKTVLVATLVLMGVATFAIGLLPTYHTAGVAAPILLVALRFLQGLGLGGEWGGAVLMAIEHGDPNRRGLNASWPQVGVPLGLLLANGALAMMDLFTSEQAFLAWGWRVPFLLSALFVFVGLWIRITVTESPLFEAVRETKTVARLPLIDVFRQHPRELLTAIGARIGTDVAFYTFSLFIYTYLTTVLALTRSVALTAVIIGSAAQLALIPLCGALSDRLGRRPVYLAGAIAAAVWLFVFFPLLETRSTAAISLATVVAFATHAAMYAPQAAFISELFSTRLRYTGASLGYQLAGVLGGAVAPLLSVVLLDHFSSWLPIAIYAAAMLAITVVAVLRAPETAHMDLADDRRGVAARF